ncbi:protein argonaute-2 [Procambarus clarkii]|uniref:protein argonaute-2 n=1 Tax=Procambarus clarkii TaxID=6728 RepID=UPI001E674494|nr:protein argonaute-2-like [Procambarus clarkii]
MVWSELGPDPRPPLRKPNAEGGIGTIGRKIALQANYFEVTPRTQEIVLAHYDVVIKDYKKEIVPISKKRRMAIFMKMVTTNPDIFQNHPIGFDSEKNAYSVKVIPVLRKSSKEFAVDIKDDGEKKREFFVTLTKVNTASLQEVFKVIRAPRERRENVPQFIFQMLEVMFQHTPSNRYERVGRNSFYSMDGAFGAPYDIGGGKDAVVGFFGSLRPAQWKNGSLLLNVDVAHTAFYKEQSVLDFMKEALNFRDEDFTKPLRPDKKDALQRALKKMKVQVTHTQFPRTYTVTNVGELGAARQTFPLDVGEGRTVQCTVEKYFMDTYRKRLRYPQLNCLKVGPIHRNIFIPIECCKIAKGQKVAKKLSDQETSQFIRSTAKLPVQRLQTVKDIVRNQNFSSDPMMRALQFSISDQPVNLDGRVLPAPKLQMNTELIPEKGVWDARNRTFFSSASLECWAVVNYDAGSVYRRTLTEFLDSLVKMGRERGMTIFEPIEHMEYRDYYKIDTERDFLYLKNKHPKIQMILVVLPKSKELYGKVKKTGDRIVKIVTQCVQGGNVRKNQPATVGNILLKINAKMGGTNNVLGATSRPFVFKTPVMIMGADVNHPQASDKVTPSLAAVVASIDKFASRYAVEVRHQKHRKEMILDLKEMTKNLLKTFYRTTRHKPERIVMYRDGVSESQFPEVLSYELKAMRDACTELQKDYTPAMTFLVVQKRHHTRLFCQDRDGVGRSKNIPPGTTVDTAITHPSERDFYLCSHQGIQGTSKPTHYHVLWDDNDLSMDILQTLTYAMCHLYSRCTRSVSIPTPAYYAHLVAFRAKVHIQDLCPSETSSLASGEEEGPSDAAIAQAARMDLDSEIASKHYFV